MSRCECSSIHHVYTLTPCSGYDPTKLFQRKVNKRAVPDYYDIIKEPMALSTIKSRVARGRVALETILTDGSLPSRRDHETDTTKTALDSIMGDVEELSRGR